MIRYVSTFFFSGKQKNFLPLPKDRRPNLLPTMALASNLRMAMLQKAKDAMARKRLVLLALVARENLSSGG